MIAIGRFCCKWLAVDVNSDSMTQTRFAAEASDDGVVDLVAGVQIAIVICPASRLKNAASAKA